MNDNCSNAYIVEQTYIEEEYRGSGLGPVLYGIGLELTGDDGLTSDRYSVSKLATRMWHYFSKDPNTITKQLDLTTWSGKEFLTPETEDNCNQSYVIEDMDGVWDDGEDTFDGISYWENSEFKQQLLASPLSKLYIKKSQPLLQRLRKQIFAK